MKRKDFLSWVGKGVSLIGFALAGPSRAATSIAAPQKEWESVDFEVELKGRVWPGVAVRLPNGQIYVATRLCPHQACKFDYEPDYDFVSDMVGKDFTHPIFFCRCHMSVFDPVTGARLHGPAPRGPWTFIWRMVGDRIDVTGIEDGAGTIL